MFSRPSGPAPALSAARLLPAILLCLLALPSALLAEAAAPAGPAAPAPRPVPPAPPWPDLTEPPPGSQPSAWTSWTQGEQRTVLRRFHAELEAGYTTILADNMAGTGDDAPSYTNIIGSGSAFGLGLRFAILPFLSAGATLHYMSYEGVHYYPESAPGVDFFFGPYGDALNVIQVTLTVKARVPLLVWNLGSRQVLLSRAEEIDGLVFFVKAGLGPAMLSDYSLIIRPTSGTGPEEKRLYYEGSTNFSQHLGFGLELRWSWGAVLGEFSAFHLGTPVSAWPPNSDSEALVTLGLMLGFGLYF